jgi:ATP-dependent RNA helicase DeaD
MSMAESMGEEYGPTELAAAAFKLLLGSPPDEVEDKLAQAGLDETFGEGKPRPQKRRDRDRPPFKPEHGMTRLYINVGRQDGVRPGDIVGAIANEADVPGRAIGAIELYDGFSFVDVPSNRSDQILKALNQTSIRNQKVSASIAKPVKKTRS